MNTVESNPKPALIIKMKAIYPNLSKSEQKVVRFICLDPSKIIRLSVAGFAEECKVSEATVIRACRSVGLTGYQDLKVTLAHDTVTPLQSINEEITPDDSINTIVDKVFQSTLHTLQYTRSILHINDLEKAVEYLTQANIIHIMGLGNSLAIALDLQHKLLRLGLSAVAYQDTHLQTISCSFMKPNDCLFAISHSGSTKDVVDCARIAKEQGSKVITLSNIGKSPLVEFSDVPLYTASNETRYRIAAIDSRIAQMALIDCLYTMIAIKNPHSVEGFRKIEKSLQNKKY